MLRQLTVFHRGGAVLWQSNEDANLGATPVNTLIQNVLVNERSGQESLVYDSYTLKWTFANHFKLVFVAVYFSFQKLLYIDDLLETIKREFIRMFEATLKGSIGEMTMNSYHSFNARYDKIINHFATEYKNQISVPKDYKETKGAMKHYQFRDKRPSGNTKKSRKGRSNSAAYIDNIANEENGEDSSEEITFAGNHENTQEGESENVNKNVSADPYLNKLQRTKSSGPRSFDSSKKKQKGNTQNKDGKKPNKPERSRSVWTLSTKKNLSQSEIEEFSMCDDKPQQDVTNTNEEEYTIDTVNGDVNLQDSETESEEDEELLLPNRNKKEQGGLWQKFQKLIGTSALTEEDLKPALEELEKLLTTKNVTNAIARELCDSVSKTLVGVQLGTFTTIKSTVKQAMTSALERILTPARPINVLHGIAKAREQNRPYSIVFIGVNGVGKSTSLAKVISYLKSRNLQVSVAACDTFRSGAVEQLKTHCKALKVRLFQQGYARDAAAVAAAAIREATKLHDDVVLIDTAGRMQNNERLMRQLVTLISRNNPDLVLFVGEAMAGNDGVNQLSEFNKCLQKYSSSSDARLIDGIILTKFDLVDDKVGTAINVSYESGKQIIFVGVGQTYSDLKRMHVHTLITKLLQ